MNPRIIAISGPQSGSTFSIGTDLKIGRNRSSGVYLNDPAVSPRHGRIYFEYEHALLIDLQSITGMFVNGFCFPAKILVHGDRVRIGSTIFVYLDQEEADPAMLALTPAEANWNRSTGSPDRTGAYEAAKTTVLEAFLRINASISGIRDADEIQARVFELIFQVIPVERVAILLSGHEQGRIVSATYRRIGSQNGDPFPIDETMTAKALQGGAPVCQEKVICCPLIAFEAKVGVIHAVMAAAGVEFFTGAHQHLLSSIAGFAAVALEHSRYVAWLEGENRRLNEAINIEHGMIGRSEKIKEVYQFINRAGPTDRPVLITGETGVGKELVAYAIHRNSPRSGKGHFPLNCGALTESLLESELFGYEKGAFTGAATLHKGLIEEADGGTLFLDEIGELPMHMQTRLLRVLEHGEIKRLGGSHVIHVNVRVIAATNRDLKQAIKEGRFREDLFHRLNVYPVRIPSLSERREDIPLLTAHFIKKYRHIRPAPYPPVLGISPDAHNLLASYAWPGNVRELEHAIDRAIGLGMTSYILPADLPEAITAGTPELAMIDVWTQEVNTCKKAIIERALQKTGGNRNEAAALLGLHPTYFRSLCKEFKL